MTNAPWSGYIRPPRATRPTRPARLPEWLLQAAMIAEFNKLEEQGWHISAVGDMNAGRRSRAAQQIAKATGMKAGEPDVRLYAGAGKIHLIEIKTAEGRTSEAQDDRHDRLATLGHKVHVAFLGTEAAARDYAREFAKHYVGAPDEA